MINRMIIPVRSNGGRDPQVTADTADQRSVKFRQVRRARAEHLFEHPHDVGKMGRAAIRHVQSLQMLLWPIGGRKPHVADLGAPLWGGRNRRGEPLHPLRRFDAVPITPGPASVLKGVEKNELVDGRDQIEIAFPRQVVRLDDRDSLFPHFVDLRQKTLSVKHLHPFPPRR